MQNQDEKTTLELTFYDENEKDFYTKKLTFKVPSAAVREEISGLLETKPGDRTRELLTDLISDYGNSGVDITDNELLIRKAFQDGKITKGDLNKIINQNFITKEDVRKQNLWAIDFIKKIVDTKKTNLRFDEMAQFEQPADGEFWQNQSFSELSWGVSFFRSLALL